MVTLPEAAHQLAEKRCQQQSNLEKAEQVYLNTLVVYAVNEYLQGLGFETDLESSDSQKEIMQTFLDVADLVVKNYGKLECKPVSPDAEFVYVPEEVWQDRIAYIAVLLNHSLTEAKLLGFVENVATNELPLRKLQPMAYFPGYLQDLPRKSTDSREVVC
ncbi:MULTISPECIES: DUF1822 family protein [Moorena]|uniref:DUF1822 family protein n=1 Tax=Moorena producens 3L TaxID=489825 RepID=F4XLL6_9CYAN|nr:MULTISPECIES: DUF1822 family protein [Moorena]EGJ34491.1 protein of unknown function, DUF1822 [Moorena producens 3L]NEP69430.1 DUF1822 family protein [Moorena sp. SIO3A5]OLT68235.1 hypothetical protein BI334_27370 [Moorena producens 3L]